MNIESILKCISNTECDIFDNNGNFTSIGSVAYSKLVDIVINGLSDIGIIDKVVAAEIIDKLDKLVSSNG